MNNSDMSAWEQVQIVARLSDLKEDHYRALLTLSAMMELLIEKGLLTRQELDEKARQLDSELETLISTELHPMA
jgi:hypothetical protein